MEKHKAIIKGGINRRIYYVHRSFYGCILMSTHEHVEWKDVFVGEIDKPLFNVGENVYINGLNKEVVISRVVRSTSGEVVYYVFGYEIIEDEKTKESKIEADKEIAEYEENRLKEQNKRFKDFDEEVKKKWWQFWKR